jgi:outer membrane protein assembly factor BamB
MCLLSVTLISTRSVAEDWTRFRGPLAAGVSSDTGVPVRWSADENIVWKTAMPGFGASSPITLGDKVFLTCYSGYGLDKQQPGRQEDLRHHVVCVDRKNGNILWQKRTKARLPKSEYSRDHVYLHGYASATPTVDDRVIYAFFGCSGVVAYTLSGQSLWHADPGSGTHRYGSGASPILYKNLLIVNASIESQSLIALDKATGKEVWRVGNIPDSWSTPLIVGLPGGSQELVVSVDGNVLGFDPATGEKLWECASVSHNGRPSVVADNGIVYVAGGPYPLTIAVRAGGRGKVTDSHVLWQLRKTPTVSTPLYHDGYLYWVEAHRAVAVCVKAETGEVIYEKRLSGAGWVYASLVLVDGKLYAVTRQRGTIVLAVGPEFKELARNDLGDSSVFNVTPVISNRQLLIRSDRYLYCIGEDGS